MSKRLFVFKGSNYSRAAFFTARPLFDLGPDAACSKEETARLLDCAHPYMARLHFLFYFIFIFSRFMSRSLNSAYSDLRVCKSLYNVYAVLPADLVNPKWAEWLLGKPKGRTLYSLVCLFFSLFYLISYFLLTFI